MCQPQREKFRGMKTGLSMEILVWGGQPWKNKSWPLLIKDLWTVVKREHELQHELACKPYLLYSYVMNYIMCNFRRPENLGICYVLECFSLHFFCLFRMACMNIDALIQRSIAQSLRIRFLSLGKLSNVRLKPSTASENLYWFSFLTSIINLNTNNIKPSHFAHILTIFYNSFLMEFKLNNVPLKRKSLGCSIKKDFITNIQPNILYYRFFFVLSQWKWSAQF